MTGASTPDGMVATPDGMVATPDGMASPPDGDVVADVLPFPASGDVFGDQRGGGRWMRATWHPEAGCVVLSVWRATTCIATMRVARADVPGLVAVLVGGLAESAPAVRSGGAPATFGRDTG
jgi:hypothetical protein